MKRFVILSTMLSALALIGGCRKDAPKVAQVAPPRAEHDLTPPAVGAPTTDTDTTGTGAATDTTATGTGEDTSIQDAPAAPRTYTIQKGDTLWSIAAKLLGDGKRWKDIKAANPGLDEKKLPIGKAIAIPPK